MTFLVPKLYTLATKVCCIRDELTIDFESYYAIVNLLLSNGMHELSVLLHSVHSCCRAHFAQEKEAVFKIMSNLQETIFVSFLIVADEWHWHVTVISHC
jgi:hypothetical protein